MGNAEARRQAEIVSWIRSNCPGVVAYAVLNDGLFSKSEAAKRKWMGLLPGVPDVALVHPAGAAFLEIKNPGDKPRPEQAEVMDTLQSLGARCAVCHSVDEARAILTGWGIYEAPKSENAA
jgi:hypothetical protein